MPSRARNCSGPMARPRAICEGSCLPCEMNDGDGGPMRGQGRHPLACYWMREKEQCANNRTPQTDIGVLRPRGKLRIRIEKPLPKTAKALKRNQARTHPRYQR